MKRVAISQPMLFPWTGFFEQRMIADAYIYLDDVQFSKGSFTNRVQILKGERQSWMTIPLTGKGTHQSIIQLEAAGTAWKTEHIRQLEGALKGAPYLDTVLAIVKEVYAHDNLCDLLIASSEAVAAYMGINKDCPIYRSSKMDVLGSSSQRVLDLTLKLSGTHYITGHGAMNYLDHEHFANSGVSVKYMRYGCTPWPQPRSKFTPYVSILDLIARVGKDARSYLAPDTIPWRQFINEKNEG